MLDAQDLVVLLTMSSIALFVTTIGFAIAWIRARERVIRLDGNTSRRTVTKLADPERLEQAIGAISLEVERIGEHQRFVTKLLAERDSARAPKLESGSAQSMRSPVPPAS